MCIALAQRFRSRMFSPHFIVTRRPYTSRSNACTSVHQTVEMGTVSAKDAGRSEAGKVTADLAI